MLSFFKKPEPIKQDYIKIYHDDGVKIEVSVVDHDKFSDLAVTTLTPAIDLALLEKLMDKHPDTLNKIMDKLKKVSSQVVVKPSEYHP